MSDSFLRALALPPHTESENSSDIPAPSRLSSLRVEMINQSCHSPFRSMNAKPRTALALIALPLALLPACSKKDKVISVEDDDPAMTAAISEARQTLPQF